MIRGLLVSLTALVIFSAPVLATPLPGLNGTTAESIPVIGRLFPEALQTNDYIGYFEASDSFNVLHERYPDLVEVQRVGKSYGLPTAGGQVVQNDVFLIEVTNEKSAIPFDEKIHLVFNCSIHGNEKGGREGCMRVIEDFAKGLGIAAEEPKLVEWLDYMVLAFSFPNTDGWVHDEPEYFAGEPGTMYNRGNGNGSDLNRQWPTIGYLEIDQSHKTLAEPEAAALAPLMRDRYTNVWYAIDIHGMLNPADGTTTAPDPQGGPTEFQRWAADDEKGHFVLGLLSSQMLNQDEFFRQTRMAELIRERTADCPGQIGAAYCQSPSTGAWGGSYNYWGTSWETISYTSTGTASMYMGNPYGLNAPAASYEMAYNHIVCDGVYMGCGNIMNEFHVNTVRKMVQALMEAASIDFQISLETGAMRTAYVYNPKIISTAGP
ncbi:MAG TPA: M14 family zinc carboxypeptidase, partial [Candidatus Thermoplasmatota archaeon]